MLCKLPKNRLGEALEFLEESLDSTLTGNPNCDCDLLGMTVWLLTKIKPNRVKQSSLFKPKFQQKEKDRAWRQRLSLQVRQKQKEQSIHELSEVWQQPPSTL